MIVEVQNLCKSFGNFRAIDDVSFRIERGSLIGLVGPNGAGKTTIVHMLLGLITPDSGDIRLFGASLARNRAAILSRLNFTSPYASFPGRLTVMENLLICAKLYGVSKAKSAITDLLEQFKLAEHINRPVSRLSSGEVTRMALCKAFLSKPELLLLDEPTAYMDPFASQQTRATLLDLQRRLGTTILITSHNMHEVQQICDGVIVLNKGRILSMGSSIDVTRAVLGQDRDTPALEEVFTVLALSA